MEPKEFMPMARPEDKEPKEEILIGKREVEGLKDQKPKEEILIGKREDEEKPREEQAEEEKKTTKVICSWCKKVIEEIDGLMADGSNESHGICSECRAKYEKKKKEIEESRKGKEQVEKSVRHCSECGAKIGERIIICDVCGTRND